MAIAIQEVKKTPVKFDGDNAATIISYRFQKEQLYFTYRVNLVYDSKVLLESGINIQIRVVENQKRLPTQQVTKRDMLSGNALKIVKNQPLQSFLTKHSPHVEVDVPRVDLNKKNLSYEVIVPASLIKGQFVFQLVLVDIKNNVTISDTSIVNHDENLNVYDIPGSNFSLRVGYIDDNTLALEASSFDESIGSFNFFVKNETPIDFRPTRYDSLGSSAITDNKTAQITYNIEEGQKLKFAVTPTSRFTNKKMSQAVEVDVGSSYTNLLFPFYVTDIDDARVVLTVKDAPSKLKKIMLYRQFLNSTESKFITASRVTDGDVLLIDVQRLPQYDTVYTLDYIDENSSLKTSSSFLYFPSIKLNTLASVRAAKLEQLASKGNTITTKFKVNVSYNNATPFDQIVSDLKRVGLDNLFDEDLKKMTNNLKPLIRILASRINLQTGEEQELGIIEPGEVTYTNSSSDSFLYRFEAAIRSAPELMEGLASSQNVLTNITRDSRDIADAVSKTITNRFRASQSSFTAKFFSKASLRNSTLKYGNAASGIDLGFHAGRTGIFADITIPKTVTQISISDIKVSNLGKLKLLTWTFFGNPDYFSVKINDVSKTALIIPGQKQCYFYLDAKTKGKIEITASPSNEDQIVNAVVEIK